MYLLIGYGTALFIGLSCFISKSVPGNMYGNMYGSMYAVGKVPE